MKGVLNRGQQQELRKELRNRVRLDGSRFERQSEECCGGNNGGNKSENIKDKVSKNKVFAKDSRKNSLRNNNQVSKRTESEKRILFPKAKLVLVLFVLGGIVLAVWSVSNANPSALQIGSVGVLESFSVSHDENTSDQGANTQSTNGIDLGDSISLDSSASWQRHYSNDLPSGFDEEIGLTGESVVVSNEGRTIGYVTDGSVEDTMTGIRNALEEKGWSYVPSGQESVATFVKDTGIFCWLAVSCVSVEGETSVVLVPEKNPEQ